MTFVKGRSGNINGRPKGSKNKSPLTLREKVIKFIENNIDNLQKDFNELDPEKRLYFFEKILTYTLPKQISGRLGVTGIKVGKDLADLANLPDEIYE